jgi:hypothetical protein
VHRGEILFLQPLPTKVEKLNLGGKVCPQLALDPLGRLGLVNVLVALAQARHGSVGGAGVLKRKKTISS